MAIAQYQQAPGFLRTQAHIIRFVPGWLTTLHHTRGLPFPFPTHSSLLPYLKVNLWSSPVQTCKKPVDTAAPLVPHDCGLATHDKLQRPGTKDNQISLLVGISAAWIVCVLWSSFWLN